MYFVSYIWPINLLCVLYLNLLLAHQTTAVSTYNTGPNQYNPYGRPDYRPDSFQQTNGYFNDPQLPQQKYDRNAAEPPPPPSVLDSNSGAANSADPLLNTTYPVNPDQSYQPVPNTVAPPPVDDSSNPTTASAPSAAKSTQLQRMVQQLYMAQGQVQLEAAEIQRAQTIASAAQQNLEDAANNVRVITAALRAAQETVATAALRAQTAQLQLAAHDQLLFTARQKVDALSAQMVGLQAELGITSDQRLSVDLPALLQRLRAPLPPNDQPKPVAATAAVPPQVNGSVALPVSAATDKAMVAHSANGAPHSLVIHSAGKRSSSGPQRDGDPLTSAAAVHDLLSWVRRAKDDDVARATAADDERREEPRGEDGRQQRYVDDFVANMQRLSAARGAGRTLPRLRDGRDEWLAQRNADLIRRTVRSVRQRRRAGQRQHRRRGGRAAAVVATSVM